MERVRWQKMSMFQNISFEDDSDVGNIVLGSNKA